MVLDEAKTGQALAFLVLASLTGDASAAKDPGSVDYDLATKPGETPIADPGGDTAKLVDEALSRRPETRAASIAADAIGHAKAAAAADLMPTLLLTGNLAYSDPDPRAFPPVDKFNLTWSAGVRLRYDLGGLPGALKRREAAASDLEKARADLEKTRNGIALDVRRCLLTLNKTRNSLELTKGMVKQAEENLRVTKARFDNGMLKRSDLLLAQIALLRARFAITNKTIDIEIAEADLQRALASKPLP
jgi:outer membrane protein TolC